LQKYSAHLVRGCEKKTRGSIYQADIALLPAWRTHCTLQSHTPLKKLCAQPLGEERRQTGMKERDSYILLRTVTAAETNIVTIFRPEIVLTLVP